MMNATRRFLPGTLESDLIVAKVCFSFSEWCFGYSFKGEAFTPRRPGKRSSNISDLISGSRNSSGASDSVKMKGMSNRSDCGSGSFGGCIFVFWGEGRHLSYPDPAIGRSGTGGKSEPER